MRHSKWFILFCVVALLGLTTSCDDDDDVIGVP